MTAKQHEGHTYVCTECGSMIFNPIEVPAFGICYECLHLPGWHTDPYLRPLLGPNLPPLPKSKGVNNDR